MSSNTSTRIHALDFMRGLYIILAMIQHYTGVLNGAFGLRPDAFIQWLFYNLTPSGDHLFLALAAFNIGKRKPEQYKEIYFSRVKLYAALFVFFFFESFYRTYDLGHALTWGPLLTWMVVLILLATVHRFFGWLGVATLFLLQMSFWGLPSDLWAKSIEEYVRASLELPTFSYESRIDYFIGSGCIGYLLGYYFHHAEKVGTYRMPLAVIAGLVMIIPFALYGQYWTLNLDAVWQDEYLVASQFVGIWYIWGVQVAAIAAAVSIELFLFPLWVPIIDWCGRFSFLVFAVHFSFFMHVLLPLRLLYANLKDVPLACTIEEMCVFMAGSILFSWFMQRSGLFLFMHYQGVVNSRGEAP